eukprot:1116659-Rhodomonas_salina.2
MISPGHVIKKGQCQRWDMGRGKTHAGDGEDRVHDEDHEPAGGTIPDLSTGQRVSSTGHSVLDIA